MAEALPWIFGGAIGGGIALASKSGDKDKAKNAANDADQRQKDLENSLKTQQGQESQQNKNAVRDAAAAKQRAAAGAAGGRSSTILTNPLGVPNNPADEQKTILG